MARVKDILRHPVTYAGRARWKAGHFWRCFRKVAFHTPEWQRACNQRREVLDYGPLHIFLESASPCNLRCPMCPTGVGAITRKHGYLNLDLAEKLANELKHQPKQVGLWLGGEPLLHKDLAEIIRVLAVKDLPVAMHTNATRLTPERSRELIEAGLKWISFSFDGFSREEYAKLRVGGDYDETLGNIMAFLRLKQDLKSETPHVVIQMVHPPNDENDGLGPPPATPEEVIKLFEGLPVDEYHSLLAHAWSGQLEGPQVAPNRYGVGQRMACRLPYTDLTIAWNGDVVSCCGDLDSANILGNFRDENLYDLWNNEHFQKFRRDMHTHEIESRPLCGTCERIWTNPHRNDFELRLSLLRYRLKF